MFMLWTTLVHEFHVSYSHTEWNLLFLLCDNYKKKIWKFCVIKLEYKNKYLLSSAMWTYNI